ncbi:MAG: hypothetical protein ACT6RD_11420 [Brevundimonas sp.]|uniref:hypothetical protein n=1 Tax=Brevundimonas sp. TaxID=1871086 RepID=UPI00403379FC
MISTKTHLASRAALVAVLSAGLLSAAACNRSSTETAEGGEAVSASNAVDATPSTGEMASNAAASTGASSSRGATRTAGGSGGASGETLDRQGSTATTAMAPAPADPGTTRETIEVTKSGLSPAGASSGPTAPN